MPIKRMPLSGMMPLILLFAVLGLATSGHANPEALQTLTIPASSCLVSANVPEEENPFKGLGTYARFTTGVTEIHCPLPVKDIGHLQDFNFHYRDFDGYGTASTVQVQLERTFSNDEGSLISQQICRWNSDHDGPGTIGYRKETISCVHDFGTAFYYFFIRLQVGRNQDAGEATFFGIDFTVTPTAPGASCIDLFGDAPGFRFCDETSSTCSFSATTGGGTCDQMCRSLGSTCVGALDNEGSSCRVTPNSNDTCHTPRQSEICVCER